jgi:hypothetical protein
LLGFNFTIKQHSQNLQISSKNFREFYFCNYCKSGYFGANLFSRFSLPVASAKVKTLELFLLSEDLCKIGKARKINRAKITTYTLNITPNFSKFTINSVWENIGLWRYDILYIRCYFCVLNFLR